MKLISTLAIFWADSRLHLTTATGWPLNSRPPQVNALAKHFVIHLGPRSQTATSLSISFHRFPPAPPSSLILLAVFPAGSDVAINRSIHFPVSILANCSSWIFFRCSTFSELFFARLQQIVCSALRSGVEKGGYSLTTLYKIFNPPARVWSCSLNVLPLSWQLKVFNEFFSKLIEVNVSWKMH